MNGKRIIIAYFIVAALIFVLTRPIIVKLFINEIEPVTEEVIDDCMTNNTDVDSDDISEDETVSVRFNNEFDELIFNFCEQYNVDYELALSISRLETGNYSSEVFKRNFNFGGLLGSNGYFTYQTVEDGAEAFVKLIKWYTDNNMKTPHEIGRIYCPSSNTWGDVVCRIMKERPWDI